MKKFLLGTIGLVAMAAPAVAADLPARTYTKAPPPVVMPVYDWSGFYIGGNGGWGESRNCWGIVPLAGAVIPDGCITSLDGLGLFTGQIGYAWNATLLYLKGGAAVTSNSAFINSTLGGVGLASISSTRWGGTVGIGGEYGFSPNWTVGIEYDHLFMGSANNSFSVANPLLAGALNRISQDVDMVTLRFSYKFGGYGAPVVSKY